MPCFLYKIDFCMASNHVLAQAARLRAGSARSINIIGVKECTCCRTVLGFGILAFLSIRRCSLCGRSFTISISASSSSSSSHCPPPPPLHRHPSPPLHTPTPNQFLVSAVLNQKRGKVKKNAIYWDKTTTLFQMILSQSLGQFSLKQNKSCRRV